MRTVRHILVAVKNPKDRSLPAVDKAAQLAKACGAELELFHAIATPLYVDMFGALQARLADEETKRRRQFARELEEIAVRVRKRGVKVTTSVSWDFPVYEAVLRRARRSKADLIVAERHAGRHVAPGLLQLTDWELLRLSPVPVLLVKNAQPYKNPVVLAAIDPTHAFAKPSGLDGEILQAGAVVKAALRGTLHAVHAYVPLPAGIPPSEYLKPELAKRLDAAARSAVQKRFDRELRAAGIASGRAHLVPEHPVDAIPQTVRKIGGAIVVMGAVSRSGIKRLFIGNTAERLLDKLNCDVLIVKPQRFKSRVGRTSRGTRFVTVQPIA